MQQRAHEAMNNPPISATTRVPRFSAIQLQAWLALVSVLCLCVNFYAAPAEASRLRHRGHTLLRSARSAPAPDISSALIIDARTGEVLHASNANAQRYPASLTKMMTLYLTFDALKQGKMRLTQQLPVTAHAAAMPATNLALKPGSYLPVETAIKALVVRSANDAAVVLGEALGGSEPQFAELMTKKARQLGMTGTVFKNASGLPNREQRTTARDLAVLALALNKHFPQYYSYFKTTAFAYNGVNYTTHNRVLLNYPGCDGLKTGFINASGFNLVSSVRRNNRYLVGVVMGSPTWASRDRKMMDLFDQALGIRGAPMSVIGSAGKVGLPNGGETQTASLAEEAPQGDAAPVVEAKATTATLAAPAPAEAKRAATVLTASVTKAQNFDAEANRPVPGVQVAMLQSSSGSLGTLSTSRAAPTLAGNGWGIQVGAYAKRDEAQEAARKMQNRLPQELASAQALAVADATGSIQRARLAGLTEKDARTACRKLVQQQEACFVYQAN